MCNLSHTKLFTTQPFFRVKVFALNSRLNLCQNASFMSSVGEMMNQRQEFLASAAKQLSLFRGLYSTGEGRHVTCTCWHRGEVEV